MQEMTVYCLERTLQAVLKKMETRATEISPRHRMYKMTAAQLETELWATIEKELTEHCASVHADNISLYAFVVGAPLDDTVFMCTGIDPVPDRPQRSFSVQHAPQGGLHVMADFYALLD